MAGLPKPKSLTIRAENGRLIGTDPAGNEWLVRWCGNGQYSHWTLSPPSDPGGGWYVFVYPGDDERELKAQIRVAERKFGIYR